MSPSALAAIAILALLLVAVVAWCVAYVWCLSYWPVRRRTRERLAGSRLYHYRPSAFVEELEDGTVHLSAQLKWQVLFPAMRRVKATYLYVGRNGRGSRWNHQREKPGKPYSLVEIDGADFMAWAGDRRIYRRFWDDAIAIRAAYEGPAMVAHGVHPRSDRKRR
ncbi:MAG: hypothetical protein JF592_18395 [Microbacterium sp.]|uniref:hypothetical protein n=1 Tax=Microbacterium sp. TaxID=51671 RepID=UPI001E156D3F|nr:hypothetical protein [Microbacterium sp.]MBW8764519.1 hypothetical protein [Microbacterium sp.]